MYVTRNALSSYEPLVGRLDGLLNDLFRPAAAFEARSEALPIRIDVRESAEACSWARRSASTAAICSLRNV